MIPKRMVTVCTTVEPALCEAIDRLADEANISRSVVIWNILSERMFELENQRRKDGKEMRKKHG